MLVKEENSPDKRFGGLREEADGLNRADPNVPHDEKIFDEPGHEGLDDYRDGAVAC
jgi:hypothetical protein